MLVLKREAKARNYQKVKAALSGENDLIKTWGIITAENPMAFTFSDEDNRIRNKELAEYLASNHIEYMKVKGQYGNPENSFFLINPSLPDMKKMANIYGQESFIYATNSKEGGFVFDAGYYETDASPEVKERFRDPAYRGRPNMMSYDKTITRNSIKNQKDANDLFTSIKTHSRNFKFQIPFFESTIRRAYERMVVCTEGKDRDHVEYDLIRTTIDADQYTEGGRWRIRGRLYRS